MDERDRRLQQIEEATAFTERHAEELSGQLVRVWESLDRLASRLGRMESRVTELGDAVSASRGEGGGVGSGGGSEGEGDGDGGGMGGMERRGEAELRARRPPHWDGAADGGSGIDG